MKKVTKPAAKKAVAKKAAPKKASSVKKAKTIAKAGKSRKKDPVDEILEEILEGRESGRAILHKGATNDTFDPFEGDGLVNMADD